MPDTEIILKDGRFLHRTFNDRDLGSQDSILRDLVKELKAPMRSVFYSTVMLPSTVAKHEPEEYRSKVDCLIGKNSAVYGMKVPYYPIKMDYMSWEPEYLVVPMTTSDHEDECESEGIFRMPWKLDNSDGIQVNNWFLMEHNFDDEDQDRYFFFITMADTANRKMKAFIPNLPNLYEEGTICMGHRPQEWNTIQEKMSNALNIFMQAPCNTDLNFDSQTCKFHSEDGDLCLKRVSQRGLYEGFFERHQGFDSLTSSVTTDFVEQIILTRDYRGFTTERI
jgi:hypothetical protein